MNDQNNFLKQRISTPVGIFVIVIVVLIAGGVVAWQEDWITKLTGGIVTTPNPTVILDEGHISPNNLYIVSETMVADYNIIVVEDSSGKVITDDLIKKNEEIIGYGIKFGCQCSTFFAGWMDESHFILKIVNANDEEYQHTVDASSGVVDETSFRRTK